MWGPASQGARAGHLDLRPVMVPRRGNPWAPVYLPISSGGLRPSPPGSSEPTGPQGWGCCSLLPGSRPPCRGPKSTGPASLHGPGGAPTLTGGTQSRGVGTEHLSSHPKTPERLWVAMVLQWPSALPIPHHLWPDHPLFGHCPCPAPRPPAVSQKTLSLRDMGTSLFYWRCCAGCGL